MPGVFGTVDRMTPGSLFIPLLVNVVSKTSACNPCWNSVGPRRGIWDPVGFDLDRYGRWLRWKMGESSWAQQAWTAVTATSKNEAIHRRISVAPLTNMGDGFLMQITSLYLTIFLMVFTRFPKNSSRIFTHRQSVPIGGGLHAWTASAFIRRSLRMPQRPHSAQEN